MSVAPQPYLSAFLKVLYTALIYARSWGYEKKISAEHLGDLMDAVHNIPEHIEHWEGCNVALFREAFLGEYDAKWEHKGGLGLLPLFNEAIESWSEPVQLISQADR